MKIKFIGGKGNPNASSVIMQFRTSTLVFDWEEGLGKLPDETTGIVVTHAHRRNAGGLRSQQLALPVWMNKFANKALGKEHYPFRRKIFWRRPFYLGEARITPVPVIHSMKAPANGLIIDVDGKRIAYFPDVLRMRDPSALNNVDLYIGDGTILDVDMIRKRLGKKIGHASIRTQLTWLQKAGVRRAVFLHFGKWAAGNNLRKLCEQLTEEFGVKTRAVYDGYEINLGRRVTMQRELPGIYLTPPHASNIVEGYKTIIISGRPAPERYMNRPLFLVEDSKLYGVVQITKGEHLDANYVRTQMSSQHQITDKEWDEWFPDLSKVWVYHFVIKEAYIPPKHITIPQGTMKWVTNVQLESHEKIQSDAEQVSPFAVINRSGDNLGKRITLKEILDHYGKPILLKHGYITLIGGLTNWGKTHGDIDMLQAEAEGIISRDQPIHFRLGRALPPELAKRLNIRYIGEYGGPFTSYVPLYDLALIPSFDRKLIRMQRIEAIRDIEGRRQAAATLKEDKVIPGRYVAPLKGYRGFYKFPEMAALDIQQSFEKEDYPLYAQKKYDGLITEWMRSNNGIIVRTDSGFDVTARFPSLVESAKHILPQGSTILCETEMWIEGEHQPREVVSGYVNSHGTPDDSNIVLNVFDMMFDGEDIHSLGYAERYQHLKKVHWGQSSDLSPRHGWNLTPNLLVRTPSDLLPAIQACAGYIASEGVVIKSAMMKYELDGLTKKMVKWKKQAEIHGIITLKHETATPHVYTYHISVGIPPAWKVPNGLRQHIPDDKDYMFIAKTFNVSEDYPIGTVVSFAFHTINWYKRQDGTQYISAYEPKIIGKSTHTEPDDANEVVRVASEKELLVKKKLQTFPMDDKPHEAVMQIHYRGKSAHMDFRIKVDGYLNGMTMMIEKPDSILDDVENVEQAKSIERNWNHYFKLRDVPQTEIEDPRRKIQIVWKSSQPVDWLHVERVVEPEESGGTKTEAGVYSVVDHPKVYTGAQKAYFKEFFIDGKVISGRWVVRLLKNPWGEKPPFVFMMWKPDDQTPYVLTKRAVEKKWLPSVGVSGLPPEIRANISTQFIYWNKNNITERLAIREALVQAIQKGEVSLKDVKSQSFPIRQPVTASAALQHRWWRGQLVVRGGPTDELWDLRIKSEPLVHFVLRDNPLEVSETMATLGKAEWKDIIGIDEIKPGTTDNPSKATPAYVEEIDDGKCTIIQTNPLKVKFDMKQLKGVWSFDPADGDMWVMRKD